MPSPEIEFWWKLAHNKKKKKKKLSFRKIILEQRSKIYLILRLDFK